MVMCGTVNALIKLHLIGLQPVKFIILSCIRMEGGIGDLIIFSGKEGKKPSVCVDHEIGFASFIDKGTNSQTDTKWSGNSHTSRSKENKTTPGEWQ